MPNYVVDPVTGILVPTPLADPGPEYATLVSNALFTLAHLTHTGASNSDGYQIPAAGINFNADISAQSNNLTTLRSTRYSNQSSVLSGSGDLACVYFKGGDLWINNGAGTPVQVTGGSIVNVTAGNAYTTQAITGNLTINATSATVLVSIDTSSTAITITLPSAGSVAAGRFYMFKDRTGHAATNNVTINPAGGDTIEGVSSLVLDMNFQAVALVSDGTSRWMVFNYDRKVYDSGETVHFKSGSTLTLDSGTTLNAATTNITGITTVVGATSFTGAVTQSGGIVTITGSNTSSINLGTGSAITTEELTTTGVVRLEGCVGVDGYVVGTGVTYTIPTTPTKSIYLCSPSAGAITLNLPAAASAVPGAIIIVKDVVGNAATHNIIVTPNGTDNIEGLNASKSIQSNWGSLTLLLATNYANNWWVML